jgi:hypothetical protein
LSAAWYEWWPANDVAFPSTNISIEQGDSITLSVVATSSTTGTATIINNTKNQKVTHTLSSTYPLCFVDAEWIVEDFSSGGETVPLANWGTVQFSKASATASNGTAISASIAAPADMVRDEHYIAQSSIDSTTGTVTIKYVG